MNDPHPASSAARSPTVLVVDDDEDCREVVCMFLQLEGYTLLEASGGQQALDLLARIPGPALILLDVMMPYMSGFEVVAALQADEVLARIPVVLVSALEEVASAGLPFLQKPVSVDALLRAVQMHARWLSGRVPMA